MLERVKLIRCIVLIVIIHIIGLIGLFVWNERLHWYKLETRPFIWVVFFFFHILENNFKMDELRRALFLFARAKNYTASSKKLKLYMCMEIVLYMHAINMVIAVTMH